MALSDAALKYYEGGLSIIPDIPRGKRPDLPAWECFTHKRAARDTLVQWWREKPTRNIGIVAGEVSGGLVILDFDAISAFEAFGSEFPDLMDTRIHLSGSQRGYHCFYFVSIIPASAAFTTSFGRIEVKANGTQVVAPPSVHPSGNLYSIHSRQKTQRIKDLSAVVDWLKFNTPHEEPRAVNLPRNDYNLSLSTRDFLANGSPQGERNNRVFKAACDFAGNGIPQAEAEALIIRVSGLPAHEAKRTINSAYHKQRVPARPPSPNGPNPYLVRFQQRAVKK